MLIHLSLFIYTFVLRHEETKQLFKITQLVNAGKNRNIEYKYWVNLDVC